MDAALSDEALVALIDQQVSHIWMVRTFLKHCDEAEEDDELCEVFRDLYDFMLALGGPASENDHAAYLKVAKRKFRKLKTATDLFLEIQPEISSHTNFEMSATSLKTAVYQIGEILDSRVK